MQEQDTVNLQYISILQKEVKAYKGLKDFEKVAALRESIISIIDGINSKDKQNAALELNAIHKADEQEEYIAEQTLQLRIRNISLAFWDVSLVSFYLCYGGFGVIRLLLNIKTKCWQSLSMRNWLEK